MDSVVKKIQGLDIRLYRGRHRKLGLQNDDHIDDPQQKTTVRGDKSLTDGLTVQPKAVETAPSRPLDASPPDLSRAGNAANRLRGPQPPSSPLTDHLHATPSADPLHPENSPTPVDSPLSSLVPSTPDRASPQPAPAQQGALCGEVDALFIRTVTAAELVCGERKYKCSGCLRYYDHLVNLLGHIDQGWREGFSCRVFYRKLRSMQERGMALSSAGREVDRELGSAHVAPADERRSHTSAGKKADMIHKWLQKTDLTAVLH